MATEYPWLMLGDCLERMKEIPDGSVDLILCDLPYGTTACKWDVVLPFEPLWEQYWRVLKSNGVIALFAMEPFASRLRLSQIKHYKYDWFWKKERPTNIFQVKKRPGKTVENICVFYKRQPNFFPQKVAYSGKKRANKVKNGKLGFLVDGGQKIPHEYKDDGTRYPTEVLEFKRDVLTSNLHPTQKPVALLEYLIKTYTNENETVLDNTMGSGSTGVACINTNRRFIGIEKDEKYFGIAQDRIDAALEDKSQILFSNGY